MDCGFAKAPDREAIQAQLRGFAHQQGYATARIHIGGGAVLNACQVLEHPPALYFKRPKKQPGGGSLWDFAATACLFEEAGAQ